MTESGPQPPSNHPADDYSAQTQQVPPSLTQPMAPPPAQALPPEQTQFVPPSLTQSGPPPAQPMPAPTQFASVPPAAQPFYPVQPSGYDTGSLPVPPVQPAMAMPHTGPLPVGQPGGYPPTGQLPTPSSRLGGRGLTITLMALALVFLAGAVTMTTLYFTARSHLDSTTQQLSTTNQQLSATKSQLAGVQGQLTQANTDNQNLTTQKNDLTTQIAGMMPCAKSAKALADLLQADLNKNANPFLDPNIVTPMSNEIRDCV